MGDGEFMNNQYRGGDFLQRGIGQFANLRWGMARKRGWYFCINSMFHSVSIGKNRTKKCQKRGDVQAT